MSAAVIIAFLVLAVAAVGFVVWPVLRWKDRASAQRTLAGTAAALFVLGVGVGTYLMIGSPSLAVRNLSEPSAADLPGLVAALAQRVRERPRDVMGWTLLGRGYLTLNDPSDAAAAFRRALTVAGPQERPTLYSAFGEALTTAASGAVGPEAERAFTKALAANPKDFAARFYLGQAFASRGDEKGALAMWQSLLADTPPNASWRAGLIDRIALLKAQTGGAAPDIGTMVAQLADRLRIQPNDSAGWERLIRAYAVLGDLPKAKAALDQARRALKGDAAAQARLALEARQLKLQK
jgi:cytochrome c-type biogenesis protein CcmH